MFYAAGAAQKEAGQLTELGMKVVWRRQYPGNESRGRLKFINCQLVKKTATKDKFKELYGSVSSDFKYNLNVDAQFIVVVGTGL